MAEAEKLHQRTMQLKNEIAKPLVTLMDRCFDVGRMLETIAESASAGMVLERFKWGQSGDREHKKKQRA